MRAPIGLTPSYVQSMPIIERHWEKLTDEQWDHFAKNWLLSCRDPGWGDEGGPKNEATRRWGTIGVNLGMWGPPEWLWHFVLLTVSIAETNDDLGAIAAGPIECLLGRFGPEYIDRVEQETATNEKFAKAVKGCNQYMMTDEVWERVKRLQENTPLLLS